MPKPTVREAVTAFDDLEHFQAAVDELLSSGFDRAELSLIARDDAVVEKLGHIYRRVEEVEDDARDMVKRAVGDQFLGNTLQGAVTILPDQLGNVGDSWTCSSDMMISY